MLTCEHYQRGLHYCVKYRLQCSVNIWNFASAFVKSQELELYVLSTFQVLCVAGECLDNLMLDFYTHEGRSNLFYLLVIQISYLFADLFTQFIKFDGPTPLSQA